MSPGLGIAGGMTGGGGKPPPYSVCLIPKGAAVGGRKRRTARASPLGDTRQAKYELKQGVTNDGET